jgi:hypothetical protein
MLETIQEIDDQTNHQPDSKSNPVGDTKLAHHIKATNQAKDWYK